MKKFRVLTNFVIHIILKLRSRNIPVLLSYWLSDFFF